MVALLIVFAKLLIFKVLQVIFRLRLNRVFGNPRKQSPLKPISSVNRQRTVVFDFVSFWLILMTALILSHFLIFNLGIDLLDSQGKIWRGGKPAAVLVLKGLISEL